MGRSAPWRPGRVLNVGTISLTVSTIDLVQRNRSRSPFWVLLPVPFIGILATVLYAKTVPPPEPPLFVGRLNQDAPTATFSGAAEPVPAPQPAP